MSEILRAAVRSDGRGGFTLDDPLARVMSSELAKCNCLITLRSNLAAIEKLKRRAQDLGLSSLDSMILVVNPRDCNGRIFVRKLVRGKAQKKHKLQQASFVQCLLPRLALLEMLTNPDSREAHELRAMQELPVLVIDHGTLAVFLA